MRAAARLVAAVALFSAAPAARAHRGEATRSVRLQISTGGVEGLLVYRVPPGPSAQLLLGVPRGLVPGERPGESDEQALGARAAPEALRGLRAAVGPEGALPASTPPRLLEAKARRTASGGIEAFLFVRLAERAPAPGELVLLEAESGLRLRATLSAAEGTRLARKKGVGRAAAGGLALRPRPGRPCAVLVEKK
jgi:hypothetical protein